MTRAPRLLAPLAIATAAATYALVVLGSTVRVTESGMGCPGWPLCYGQLGPIDRFHAILEQSHRYVVVVVTLLVLATAVAAWRQRRAVRVPAWSAVGIIAVQIVLGAVTVITHNAPFTVALHLLTALLLLAVVVATAVSACVPARAAPPGRRRVGPLAWWTAGATYVLLLSGSLVVDGGASYACPAWPVCGLGGQPWQLVLIQYVHRALVLVTATLIALLVMRAARRWHGTGGGTRVVADLVAVGLLAQIAVGGLVATQGAPPALQDIHLALAAGLWVGVVTLLAVGWNRAADVPEPAAGAAAYAVGGAPGVTA